MKNLTIFLPIAMLLGLTACGDQKTEVAGGTEDAVVDNASNAALELPPMVMASKTYRCKDGGLIFVDFMSDSKTANLRTEKTGAITMLKAEEAGQPFTAEGGYSLEGSGDEVTATLPGKSAQSCKA